MRPVTFSHMANVENWLWTTNPDPFGSFSLVCSVFMQYFKIALHEKCIAAISYKSCWSAGPCDQICINVLTWIRYNKICQLSAHSACAQSRNQTYTQLTNLTTSCATSTQCTQWQAQRKYVTQFSCSSAKHKISNIINIVTCSYILDWICTAWPSLSASWKRLQMNVRLLHVLDHFNSIFCSALCIWDINKYMNYVRYLKILKYQKPDLEWFKHEMHFETLSNLATFFERCHHSLGPSIDSQHDGQW